MVDIGWRTTKDAIKGLKQVINHKKKIKNARRVGDVGRERKDVKEEKFKTMKMIIFIETMVKSQFILTQ